MMMMAINIEGKEEKSTMSTKFSFYTQGWFDIGCYIILLPPFDVYRYYDVNIFYYMTPF